MVASIRQARFSLEAVMAKHVENFFFGLAFGCGFCIAQAVLQMIAAFLARASH